MDQLHSRLNRKKEFKLPKAGFLSLKNVKGSRITCIAGGLLLTAFNELNDVELYPQETFVVPNNGLVLLEGLNDSFLTLTM